MNRQDKIKIIEAVKLGMPLKFAILQGQTKILIKKPDDKEWKCGDMVVTEYERKKYFPDNTICIINKSGAGLDENGLVK